VFTGAVFRPHIPEKVFQLTGQWSAAEQPAFKIDVFQPSTGNQDAVALLQASPEIFYGFDSPVYDNPNCLV
jgi:hypothetical protein